jgi:glutaredoxin
MIVLYVLEGCPYCINSINMLNEYNIKYKAIIVQPSEKDYYKKLNKMNTFPQIFMKANKDKFIKIGGNNDLVNLTNQCMEIKNSYIPIDTIYNMYYNMYKK